MQSDLQDAPPMVKHESSTSPRPLKFLIKRPMDISRVNAEVRGDTSIVDTSNNVPIQSNLEDSPPISSKDRFKSPRLKKKGRKRSPRKSDGDESIGSTSNQLVLYNPGETNATQDIIPISNDNDNYTSFQNISNRVLPSVGAFTVQCADCFKWRLIPTKEKYEEIREHILEKPFTCEGAREWRPDITCNDPADISQDGSRLWAIDKPNIAQPPPGWERQLRIRGEGGTKFADVYYSTPTGKKLRSKVEVQKYLQEHPEYIEQGVNLSQFSFQIPTPLQENYCRKRPKQLSVPLDSGSSRPLEPHEVNPLSWVAPNDEIPPLSNNGGPSHLHSPVESPSPPPATMSPPERKQSTKPRILIKPCSSSSSSSSSYTQPANELP